MISAVMPVYILNEETLELTKAAVDSLGEVELVIIDNASTVGGGWLRSVANTYIRNQTNLGYGKAVNQGLKLTTCPLVAVSNNDVRVSSNWRIAAKEILSFKSSGTVHFRMTDYDVPFSYGNKIWPSGKERWCTGSFFVIDREKLRDFYYDEELFNSYDDWDFFMRIREEGYNTVYTDRACYQHKHSHTQAQIVDREENNQRNKEYFKKKWGKYAEDIFAERYPDQMAQDYWQGFSL